MLNPWNIREAPKRYAKLALPCSSFFGGRGGGEREREREREERKRKKERKKERKGRKRVDTNKVRAREEMIQIMKPIRVYASTRGLNIFRVLY
jgi:hypothetical protein